MPHSRQGETFPTPKGGSERRGVGGGREQSRPRRDWMISMIGESYRSSMRFGSERMAGGERRDERSAERRRETASEVDISAKVRLREGVLAEPKVDDSES
jgi:hypothetical protein